jgi:peptidoglycan-associated lipoprotein
MKFLRKVFLTFAILSLTIACSTSKKGFGVYNDKNELADNVPNYVLFDVDSAKLDQYSLGTLDKQVSWLKGNPDISVVVEGHCDERGTREYNLALGAKRANAVKSYLLSSSIDSSRVATISYGKERPPVQGTGPDVWRENRRAITLIN